MARKTADLLRSMDMFETLSDPVLAKVAKLLKERRFAENQVLFTQGDRGDSLYIVTDGRVKISANDHSGREKVLAFCGEGEFFGDMAVLTGAPRSATARASTNVSVLQLRKDDFDALLASSVEAMKEMLRVVAQRQAANNQRVSEESGGAGSDVKGVVTVVFSPRGGAGTSTIASNLAVALSQAAPDRVVLIDLDLTFGQQAMLLNVVPRTSLAAISAAAVRQADREALNYYLPVHTESSTRLLVGAQRPEDGELVTADHVRALMDILCKQFLHIVVDAACSFGDPNLAVFDVADLIWLVCPADPLGVRNAQDAQRVLREVLQVPPARMRYLLNHVSPHEGVPCREVAERLGAPNLVEIPYAGEAPSSAALIGVPLVLQAPNANASKVITQMAHTSHVSAREALALAGR